MAEVIPTFEKIKSGTGSLTSEAWVDLGLIPDGFKIWIGFATFGAEDKPLSFELRTNLNGESTGTVGTTALHDYSATTTGDSVDRDLYRDGHTLVMSEVSTGVEHWWLRVRSNTGSVCAFDYFIYYTEY